jgi:hypothetical protein
MIKFLLRCISFIWSGVTGIYSVALYDKITKPHSKNIGAQGYLIIGFVIVLLWTLIYFSYKKINKNAIQ